MKSHGQNESVNCSNIIQRDFVYPPPPPSLFFPSQNQEDLIPYLEYERHLKRALSVLAVAPEWLREEPEIVVTYVDEDGHPLLELHLSAGLLGHTLHLL